MNTCMKLALSIGLGLLYFAVTVVIVVCVFGLGPAFLLSWGEKPGDAGGDIILLTGPLSLVMGGLAGLAAGFQAAVEHYKQQGR